MQELKDLLSFWPFVTTLVGNVYFFVLFAALLSFMLIGLSLIIKYSPLILNDLRTVSTNEIPDIGRKLWLAFILLIPIFLDAGPVWYMLWWFIIFWGYVTKSEKRIAFIFLFLVLMSSWIAHIGAGFISYTNTQANKEIFLLEYEVASPKDSLLVASWIQDNPADSEPMNAQAIDEIKKNNYTSAIELLSHALDLEPNNPRYYNHLGIALAGIGKNAEAITAFKNSVTLDPRNHIYYYNISRLHQALYNFYEAEQSLQKASSLNPRHIREFLDQESVDKENKFVIVHVPIIRQLARQMHLSEELKDTADSLWDMGIGLVQRKNAILLAITSALILALIGYIPQDKFTKKCSRCGNLYYVGTTSGMGLPICLQCHWLETKAKKQMQHALPIKIEDIKKYRAFTGSRSALFELLLPGLGSFIVNKTAKGVFRIIMFGTGLLMIISGGQFIHSILPSQINVQTYIRLTGIIILGVLYWRAYKSPPIRYGV